MNNCDEVNTDKFPYQELFSVAEHISAVSLMTLMKVCLFMGDSQQFLSPPFIYVRPYVGYCGSLHAEHTETLHL